MNDHEIEPEPKKNLFRTIFCHPASVFLIGLLVVSLFVLVVITLFLFYYFSSSNETLPTDESVHSYRYLHFNSRTHKTSFGLASLPQEIEEFVSSHDSEFNNYELISRLDDQTNEFICYGSCSCLEENNRRSLPSVLSRKGFYYLLSALSLLSAKTLADNYFTSECVQVLSDSCPAHLIESEIDDCKPVSTSHTDSAADEKYDGNYEFFCQGRCLPLRDELLAEKTKEYDCSRLQHEQEIVIQNDVAKKGLGEVDSGLRNEFRDGHELEMLAISKFRETFDEFCFVMSKKHLREFPEEGRFGLYSLCTGWYDEIVVPTWDHVHCRQTKPEMSESTKEWLKLKT